MLTTVLALVVLAGGISALSLSGHRVAGSRARPPDPLAQARRDGHAFLARYVDAGGRVVRRDQGRDTVSEGQAYAMLISVALGDRAEFARVWRWDHAHLQLPDGLFAYRWARGGVVGATPAADADLETAWALALAGRRFHDASYTAAAIGVAGSILQNETVDPAGHLELVAGPWARTDPATVDASYISPQAMTALASATADRSWLTLESDSTTFVRQLEAATPSHLPSDWAALAGNLTVTPTGASPGRSPAYGLDAQRVLVWFAADCSPGGRAIARGAWSTLGRARGQGGRIRYRLDGHPLSKASNPLGYVAAAAAAYAAGRRTTGAALLDRADRQNAEYHTYYGSAWLALGRILLDTSWLSPCPPGS